MDYEGPEAVAIHGNESLEGLSCSGTSTPNEALNIDNAKEHRGVGLWRELNERQINMIALSATIADGLFFATGTSLAVAGPGGAVLCYVLTGTIMASIISSLCEMTALMPVNAPVMEFPRRFLDRGIGFAIGWMYLLVWVVGAAGQIIATMATIEFRYDDGKTNLNWNIGEYLPSVIWITICLFLVISINALPVKFYGKFEYLVGCFKLTFVTMLILLMFTLDVMKPRANAYYKQAPACKYWDPPYSFFNQVYSVTGEDGRFQRSLHGTAGTFLNMWTTCVTAMREDHQKYRY